MNALEEFLDTFDAFTLNDLGPHLTCTECEVLAELFEAHDRAEQARSLREGHALADDDGDLDSHLALKAKLEGENFTLVPASAS